MLFLTGHSPHAGISTTILFAERKKQAELNRLKKSFDVFPWGKPEWINKYDQMLDLTATKTEYQKEVYGQVLQDAIKRLSCIKKSKARSRPVPSKKI